MLFACPKSFRDVLTLCVFESCVMILNVCLKTHTKSVKTHHILHNLQIYRALFIIIIIYYYYYFIILHVHASNENNYQGEDKVHFGSFPPQEAKVPCMH